MSTKAEEIRSLLSVFEQSSWNELRLKTVDVELAVSKTGSLGVAPGPAAAPVRSEPSRPSPTALAPQRVADVMPESAVQLAPGQAYLRAPSLGVVWSRPKPGAPTFIAAGQRVEPGDTICLIEVMKLFTQVESQLGGRVLRCLVADGDMVEHDTPLFLVQTD